MKDQGYIFTRMKRLIFLIDLIRRYRKEKPTENVKSFGLIQILYEEFSMLMGSGGVKNFCFLSLGS